MINKNAIKEKLLKNNYSSDHGLSRLFDQSNVYVEFWVSRYSIQTNIKLNLCYGLISNTKKNKSDEWRHSGFASVFSGNSPKEKNSYKVSKVFLAGPGSSVGVMIDALLQGQSFKEACTHAQLPLPPDKFHDLKLVESNKNENYVFRPPVTALPKNILENLVSFRQGYSSPIKDTIATVGSLYLLNKDELWRDLSGNILSQSKEIIRGLTQYLSGQTGLQFNKFDLKRLGNIEWISYSSTDEFEKSYCTVKTSKTLIDSKTGASLPPGVSPSPDAHIISCTKVVVSIKESGLSEDITDLLIECSVYNDNDLIGDQAIAVKKSNGINAEFEFEEQISSCHVKIWIKKDGPSNFKLWHHEHFDLIRSINVALNFDNTPDNSWFEELISGCKHPKTVSSQKAKSTRLHFRDKNFSLDPWNPVGQATRHLAIQVFPAPSDAFFFVQPGEDDQPRIDALSDWLKKTISKRQPNTCIFFDPFFDRLGIDLLLNLGNVRTNFVVVTNSQVKSNDDALTASDHLNGLGKVFLTNGHVRTGKFIGSVTKFMAKCGILQAKDDRNRQRATRIKDYCDKNKRKLNSFPIKIYDLVSKSSSTKQYFHDRHLLFFDSSGKLTSGYNFSNSIQGAMKRYPLLITPIPSDIFESVEKHIYEFLSEKMNFSERRKDLLFTSVQKIERQTDFKKGMDSLSHPVSFFAILLKDNSLKSLSPEQLKSNLLTRGIIDQEGNFITQQILSYRQNVLEYLNSGPQEFWSVWCDFSEMLARVKNHKDFYENIKAYNVIKAKINEILCSGNIGAPKDFVSYLEELSHLETHVGLLSDTFSKALTRARNLDYFSLRHYVRIHNYGLDIAVEIMGATDQLVCIIEKISSDSSIDETRRIIRLRCIEEIYEKAQISPSKEFLSQLGHSNLPYLKAVAAHVLYENRNNANGVFDVAWTKSLFPTDEFVLILSEWIYDLRVRANQKGETVSEEDGALYKELVSEILSNWSFQTGHLRDVLERCSGPIFGSWSISNYNDLCAPLIEAAKVSFSDLAEIWLKEVLGKIQNVASDKSHFYEPADSQLTAVAAHIFVNLSADQIEGFFKQIKKLTEDSLLQVERERIRSIDFNLWHQNMSALYWLHGLLLHILNYKLQNTIPHGDDLEDLVKRIQPITHGNIEEESMNPLLSWLVRVERYFAEKAED